jgi:threonine synthase
MSFEEVVLKGLASDGGLFIPEQIPSLPDNWASNWKDLSFSELAYEILSLYISPSEIPPADLKKVINRSYSTFRDPKTTPLVTLNEKENLYLLELFHGPTFAFKDVALQLLGNLFEYFLVRRNEGKIGTARHHLTVVGATSGDTGSAAIYGLRGKKDVSVFILHPKGRVSPVQEAQMTTVLDANVHNLAVEGTFDDCQVGFRLNWGIIAHTFRILSRLSSRIQKSTPTSTSLPSIPSTGLASLLRLLIFSTPILPSSSLHHINRTMKSALLFLLGILGPYSR